VKSQSVDLVLLRTQSATPIEGLSQESLGDSGARRQYRWNTGDFA